ATDTNSHHAAPSPPNIGSISDALRGCSSSLGAGRTAAANASSSRRLSGTAVSCVPPGPAALPPPPPPSATGDDDVGPISMCAVLSPFFATPIPRTWKEEAHSSRTACAALPSRPPASAAAASHATRRTPKSVDVRLPSPRTLSLSVRSSNR
ncbi:unnamed protein product, partial [Ectocarpus fasciculatus]